MKFQRRGGIQSKFPKYRPRRFLTIFVFFKSKIFTEIGWKPDPALHGKIKPQFFSQFS